jgi:hypothetical protein
MKRLALILLIIPTLSHAISLKHKLAGTWHGTKHRKRGITIKPDKVHFRYCRPARITEKGEITEDSTEHLGYHVSVQQIDLYGRGPNDDQHCLSQGHHRCVFSVSYWETHPQDLFLDVLCDSDVSRMFHRRKYK